jgi:murein L,D-transpeptidase YcbB/YkuD
MQTSELVIEILRIVTSWPVVIVILFFLLKKDMPKILDNFSQRIKSAKIAGQEIEFFEDLESQSKVTQAIEAIQKENPELVNKSLASVGIKQEDYEEYRSKLHRTVIQVQRSLHELGYDLGQSGIDGVTGIDTKRAIQSFQRDYSLHPDGIIGPDTIGKLNSLTSIRRMKGK